MYSYTELQNKFMRSTRHQLDYKLENNTYVFDVSHKEKSGIVPEYRIMLHGSIIAIITQDKIILDNCGYYTHTTKDRLNKILHDNRVNYAIYQSHFTWYIFPQNSWNNDDRIPFYNGITFVYESSPLMGVGWRLSTE